MGKNRLYDKELDAHYYKEMNIGKTRVLIVDPEITEEEKEKRLDQLSSAISSIVGYKVEVIEKE